MKLNNNKSFIQVIACQRNHMQPPFSDQEVSYVTAFVSSTLDPQLIIIPDSQAFTDYFITNIRLTKANIQHLDQFSQQLKLNQQFSLIIQRNSCKMPIVDVANFQHIVQGWQSIISDQQILSKFKTIPQFKRGLLKDNIKCISQLQIFDEVQQQKVQQVTQPSLTQKNQLMHSYFKIQAQNLIKYINFVKKSQVDISNAKFKPYIQSLYEKLPGQVDIPNIAVLCFPEGVKILKKQTGFKFFSFIITNDSAERFYCKSLIFSEKCSSEMRIQLYQKYGIVEDKNLSSQKVFTLISQYNCTQHTNQCLEQLYRTYLSQPFQVFKQKVNNLANSFIINKQTNKVRLQLQKQVLSFKMCTSYPQTSTEAIYAVFKFLDVQHIVTILQNILLERKIFFISECLNLTGLAIQAFLSFIYPLNWVHPIINPLSTSIIEYTEAPLTIMYGLSNNLSKKIKTNVDGLFVYIDKNKVQLKNAKQASLMINLRKQLIQRLKQFSVYDFIDVRDYLMNPQNLALFKTQKTQDPNFDAYKIRNIFFELTVFMLKNYGDYFKQLNMVLQSQKSSGIKKYYRIDELLDLYKKDPFMKSFFQTSLFSILTERKLSQPNHKWIKTLDKAIKKIASYSKHYIQEESDICSDSNEPQQPPVFIPRGCLSLISSSFSRQSDDEKHPKSSPSPKRFSIQKQYEDQKYISPTKNQGRMSLPIQYQKRSMPLIQNHKNLTKRSSIQTQIKRQAQRESSITKQQKQTDKGSQTHDKSESQTPQLKQKQVIVYEFEINDNKNEPAKQGLSTLLCSFLSYPYKKASQSVVTRWTRWKMRKVKNWKNKKTQNYEVNMAESFPGPSTQLQNACKLKKQENVTQ